MTDVLIILRKELSEVFSRRSRTAELSTMAGQVAVFGFLIPFMQAPAWIAETQVLSFIFLLLPMVLSFNRSAAVFAGERERTTLESLLATPLAVSSLFFGKALAVVTQVYTMIVTATLLSVVALNVAPVSAGAGLIMYSGPALFALLVLSLAVAMFAVSGGVLISLRAGNVRTAQSLTTMLSLACLVPLMTGWIQIRLEWGFLVPAVLALGAIDAVFISFALARFNNAAAVGGRGSQ